MYKFAASKTYSFFPRFKDAKAVAAFAVSALFFYSNVLTAHSAESAFWADRRDAANRMKRSSELTSNVANVNSSAERQNRGLSAEQYQLLAQLPKATSLDFGMSESVTNGLPSLGDISREDLKSAQGGGKNTPTWISSLILPYGAIRDVYLAKSPNAPIVVHIQDAHGIEDAQRNMAAMIQGLREERGITLVGLEGAQGEFALEPYRSFPDAAITKGIAEYFMKDGTIGGPEFAGITAAQPPLLWGVEDLSKYESNIQAFKDSVKYKPAASAFLAELKDALFRLKATSFSQDLKEFDRHFVAYKNQQEGLGTYVRYLMDAQQGSDLRFSNLKILLNTLDWEESLDFKKVERERLQLVEAMARKLPSEKLSHLVQQSLLYRLGRMGYGDYHRFLRTLCRDNNIDLESYSQMNSYITYVLLAEQINRNELLVELSKAEQAAQDALAVTPEQKKLVAINRNLILLEKLTQHAMTMPDWWYYDKNKSELLKIADRIREVAAPLNVTLALTNAEAIPLAPRSTAAGQNNNVATADPSHPRTLPFATMLQPYEDFCRYAIGRNSSLLDNLLDKIRAENASSAVLVAGGFHTEGLTQLLRQKDVSYVVVTPKINEVPKENNYLDVFAHDPLPIEKMFDGDKIYLVSPRVTANKVALSLSSLVAQRRLSSLYGALQSILGSQSSALLETDKQTISDKILGAAVRQIPGMESFEMTDVKNRPGIYSAARFALTVLGLAVKFEVVLTKADKAEAGMSAANNDGAAKGESVERGTIQVGDDIIEFQVIPRSGPFLLNAWGKLFAKTGRAARSALADPATSLAQRASGNIANFFKTILNYLIGPSINTGIRTGQGTWIKLKEHEWVVKDGSRLKPLADLFNKHYPPFVRSFNRAYAKFFAPWLESLFVIGIIFLLSHGVVEVSQPLILPFPNISGFAFVLLSGFLLGRLAGGIFYKLHEGMNPEAMKTVSVQGLTRLTTFTGFIVAMVVLLNGFWGASLEGIILPITAVGYAASAILIVMHFSQNNTLPHWNDWKDVSQIISGVTFFSSLVFSGFAAIISFQTYGFSLDFTILMTTILISIFSTYFVINSFFLDRMWTSAARVLADEENLDLEATIDRTVNHHIGFAEQVNDALALLETFNKSLKENKIIPLIWQIISPGKRGAVETLKTALLSNNPHYAFFRERQKKDGYQDMVVSFKISGGASIEEKQVLLGIKELNNELGINKNNELLDWIHKTLRVVMNERNIRTILNKNNVEDVNIDFLYGSWNTSAFTIRGPPQLTPGQIADLLKPLMNDFQNKFAEKLEKMKPGITKEGPLTQLNIGFGISDGSEESIDLEDLDAYQAKSLPNNAYDRKELANLALTAIQARQELIESNPEMFQKVNLGNEDSRLRFNERSFKRSNAINLPILKGDGWVLKDEIAAAIRTGEPFDVVVRNSENIAQMLSHGSIAPERAFELARKLVKTAIAIQDGGVRRYNTLDDSGNSALELAKEEAKEIDILMRKLDYLSATLLLRIWRWVFKREEHRANRMSETDWERLHQFTQMDPRLRNVANNVPQYHLGAVKMEKPTYFSADIVGLWLMNTQMFQLELIEIALEMHRSRETKDDSSSTDYYKQIDWLDDAHVKRMNWNAINHLGLTAAGNITNRIQNMVKTIRETFPADTYKVLFNWQGDEISFVVEPNDPANQLTVESIKMKIDSIQDALIKNPLKGLPNGARWTVMTSDVKEYLFKRFGDKRMEWGNLYPSYIHAIQLFLADKQPTSYLKALEKVGLKGKPLIISTTGPDELPGLAMGILVDNQLFNQFMNSPYAAPFKKNILINTTVDSYKLTPIRLPTLIDQPAPSAPYKEKRTLPEVTTGGISREVKNRFISLFPGTPETAYDLGIGPLLEQIIRWGAALLLGQGGRIIAAQLGIPDQAAVMFITLVSGLILVGIHGKKTDPANRRIAMYLGALDMALAAGGLSLPWIIILSYALHEVVNVSLAAARLIGKRREAVTKRVNVPLASTLPASIPRATWAAVLKGILAIEAANPNAQIDEFLRLVRNGTAGKKISASDRQRMAVLMADLQQALRVAGVEDADALLKQLIPWLKLDGAELPINAVDNVFTVRAEDLKGSVKQEIRNAYSAARRRAGEGTVLLIVKGMARMSQQDIAHVTEKLMGNAQREFMSKQIVMAVAENESIRLPELETVLKQKGLTISQKPAVVGRQEDFDQDQGKYQPEYFTYSIAAALDKALQLMQLIAQFA